MSSESRVGAALSELAKCREDIEAIDAQIIGLLGRRLVLGRRTGEVKRRAGLPILDPTREAAVIRRVTSQARDAGLPAEEVREIFWRIIGMSREQQQGGLRPVEGSGE